MTEAGGGTGVERRRADTDGSAPAKASPDDVPLRLVPELRVDAPSDRAGPLLLTEEWSIAGRDRTDPGTTFDLDRRMSDLRAALAGGSRAAPAEAASGEGEPSAPPPGADPRGGALSIRSASGSRIDGRARSSRSVGDPATQDLVAEMVRRELRGVMGEEITRDLRRLVHREVMRAISVRDAE